MYTEFFVSIAMKNPRPGRGSGSNRSRKGRSKPPVAIWLGSVMALAFVISAVFFGIFQGSSEPGEQKTGEAGPAETEPRRLDFYEMLPKARLVVPPPQPEQADGQVYALQVGSFRNLADANSHRARLILMGLDVFTQKHQDKDETWHRVLVGPINSADELSQARDRLADANIESIRRKLPGSG